MPLTGLRYTRSSFVGGPEPAGSLNYADLPSAFGEVARVLARDGTSLLYDFPPARRSVSGGDLAPGWQPFDVRELPLGGYGLRLLQYADVETRCHRTGASSAGA